jgi:hypothetical protein
MMLSYPLQQPGTGADVAPMTLTLQPHIASEYPGASFARSFMRDVTRRFTSLLDGLPNPISDTGFDETPNITNRLVHGFAQEGLVNIVGGSSVRTSRQTDAALQ